MSIRICGFCMTGHHWNCKKIITYYEKIWVCDCPHPDDTLPDKEYKSELEQEV